MTLLVRRGFREEDFAHLHPRGSLGKGLMRAHALMHAGDAMPRVAPDARVRDVLVEMSGKKLGMTTVVDADGRLAGIITDGDLRRQLAAPEPMLDRTAPRHHDHRPGHDRAADAGRRGAEDPRGAPDLVAGRGRRRRAPSACCTCTISGERSCFDAGGARSSRRRGSASRPSSRPARGGCACCCSTSTAC